MITKRTFFLGIIGGILFGIGISILIRSKTTPSKIAPVASSPVESSGSTKGKWNWPDSLDAVKAAPENHKILFENSQVRVLEVILRPYEFEKMHTHRLPSIMFGASDGDTSHFDIIYYRYKYDGTRHKYYIKDSIRQHGGGPDSGGVNTGNFMEPEGPHRIKNLSNVKIDVFRVELKQIGDH